ncbi:MAG: dihydropteroate synthase, partial [Terriglobales bacterium]
MRPVFEWQIGSRGVQLGKRTLIMGVVNVTPDSFSDGGTNFDRECAVEYALKLLLEGADIIDVGGESTRPGAKVGSATEPGVSEKEELDRVIPVISAVKTKNPLAIISVDTYKASVTR